MDEYSDEPQLPRWHNWLPALLVLLAMGCAGTIEMQDYTTCEYPVDEVTAEYIRGYNDGINSRDGAAREEG